MFVLYGYALLGERDIDFVALQGFYSSIKSWYFDSSHSGAEIRLGVLLLGVVVLQAVRDDDVWKSILLKPRQNLGLTVASVEVMRGLRFRQQFRNTTVVRLWYCRRRVRVKCWAARR